MKLKKRPTQSVSRFSGVTPTEFMVLEYVRATGEVFNGCACSEVCGLCGTTVYKAVKSLIEKGKLDFKGKVQHNKMVLKIRED